MIGLQHYLVVAAALFVIGIFGIFLNRKNVIVIWMSIELMLLAVTVAAAEAAIGLAILVVFFRNRGSIDVEDANVMKG